MTLPQMIARIVGTYVDYDKAYGAQCVDVIKYYYKNVLGIAPFIGNAIDYWYRIDTRFVKVKNTLRGVPPAGAVVVFNYKPYGHVVVATGNGNWLWFDAVSQNDPLGSKVRVKRYWYYRGVLGWLVKK